MPDAGTTSANADATTVAGRAVVPVDDTVESEKHRESERGRAELAARLEAQERDLEATREELDKTRTRLAKMEAQMIAQERMATLGAMTAGIAHEIKNPLNFVVNFAALSVDLIAEIREEIAKLDEKPTKTWRDNVDESLCTLADNCAKVNQHGLRADGIVRSMQMHARGQAGQFEWTDMNRLVEDNIALAYHGARSSDREFNATIEKQFDYNIPKIHVMAQEMGRVFLNLFSNGFYAVRGATSKGRVPTIRVSTHNMDDTIEIRIADNGLGIPEAVRNHIFEAFFTTKPVGEGTGLGLSITRDIIEQVHRGMIRFESVTDEGTEFIIELPKSERTA